MINEFTMYSTCTDIMKHTDMCTMTLQSHATSMLVSNTYNYINQKLISISRVCWKSASKIRMQSVSFPPPTLSCECLFRQRNERL